MNVTPSQTRRIRKVSAGFLLIVIVLFAHHYLPNQASLLVIETIRSLHGPGFGVVALSIMMIARHGGQPTAAYTKAVAFSMILAGLAEAIQIPGPRAAQISDLFVDALGILGFLGTAVIFDRGIRNTIGKRRVTLLALIAVPALVLTIMPTLRLSHTLVMRSQSLPQILSFDEVWEQTYSSETDARPEIIPAPAGWPVRSGKIARLHSAGRWGIMLHIYPHPDWSGYSAVSFIAAINSKDSRYIAVGIWGISPGQGIPQSRYYTRIKVGPEPARYCISIDEVDRLSTQRKFDVTHIYELVLSDADSETGIELLVDDFRLEKIPGNCSLGRAAK